MGAIALASLTPILEYLSPEIVYLPLALTLEAVPLPGLESIYPISHPSKHRTLLYATRSALQ